MDDDDFVDFLQWALPRLDKRWEGFRKPRGQVRKRVKSRLEELGLESLDAYRRHLEEHDEEWDELDFMTRVTISQFYRHRGTWDLMREEVVPGLAGRARDREVVRAWSAGCASGEEPYTLRILWELEVDAEGLELEVCATDIDPHMVERARRARYPASSVRELPDAWVERAFERRDDGFVLRDEFRDIDLEVADVTEEMPDGPLDLVLCSYTVFIYYEEQVARAFLRRLSERVVDGAALMVGPHEEPPGDASLERWEGGEGNLWRFVGE